MANPRLLQVGPLTDRFNQRLAASYDVQQLWTQADPVAFLNEHGAEFNIVITSARFGCSAAQLAAMPSVKAICSFGVGYDAIAVGAANARGIQISNTPDVLNDCVADLAMGLIIDSARKIALGDRFVRDGSWGAKPFPLGRSVTGKKLGIVGLGRIGKEVVKRSSGFSMEARYHNRKPDATSPLQYEADLVELARWSDFLVLTCVGGPSTHHLISTEVLEALGETGTVINVSRGTVIDEDALVAALVSGKLGGAGLDVFEAEPKVPNALLELPNVVLLPHIGSGTEETRLGMEEMLFSNLEAFLERGEVVNAV
ncbi:2-hydroxyacid dehydrogenase [Pseudomonas sp.]|uniref:2-hydroxyacid dehydrogenase n=1 Tax=Pseudomonas sp. TaxID=306 RepID=UPI00260B19A0|nr:2-hydroxyacid dehydrogenase [Pseudomonas sp.]